MKALGVLHENSTNHISVSHIGHEPMTHNQMIKRIRDFLTFSEKYRKRKVANKATIKDEVKWIELFKKVSKAVNEYDIDKINYNKGIKI